MTQIIAFDVDGTLVDGTGQPRWPVVDMLRSFDALGWEVWVWSGGGQSYAAHIVRRLNLASFVDGVYGKQNAPSVPDVAVDDQEATLGKANILLPSDGFPWCGLNL